MNEPRRSVIENDRGFDHLMVARKKDEDLQIAH